MLISELRANVMMNKTFDRSFGSAHQAKERTLNRL